MLVAINEFGGRQMSVPVGATQWCPMNKFEQVSSDGSQMSLTERWGQDLGGPMSGGDPYVQCPEVGLGPGGSLYSEV